MRRFAGATLAELLDAEKNEKLLVGSCSIESFQKRHPDFAARIAMRAAQEIIVFAPIMIERIGCYEAIC